jgi:4-amino-4-deoxy-L-arabinose transferase-like glycosyltransferase
MSLNKILFSPTLPALLCWIMLVTVLRVAFLAFVPYPLFGDEAQYWVWAQEPAFGYYSKPPMVAWAIALFTGLGHDSEFWIRLASPLCHALTALCVYGIGREAFQERTGFWSGLLYLTLPAVWFSSGLVSTDPLLLLCWSLATWLLLCALRTGVWSYWLGSGIIAGAGLLAKYAMAFWFVGVLLALLLIPALRTRHNLLMACLLLVASLLVLAPNLYWNAQHGWLTFQHTGENAHWQWRELFHPVSLLTFWASQFAVFGPVLLGLLLGGIIVWRQTLLPHRAARLLLCLVLPVLLAISVQALLSRANANWAATAYIGGCVLVAWLAEQRFCQSWLRGSVVGHSVVALLFMGMVALPSALPPAFDPMKRLRGYDVLGQEIARVLQTLPDDTKVLTNHRMLSALLLYYGRPVVNDIRKWNPDGRVDDTFELKGSLQAGEKSPLLLVSRDSLKPVLDTFTEYQMLPAIVIQTHPGRNMVFHIALAKGFRGYPPPAP